MVGYQFMLVWDVLVLYMNVKYMLGIGLVFYNSVIFNMVGVVLYWKVVVQWDFVVGYLYMVVMQLNGIMSVVKYYQVMLLQYYSLLKCMGLYVFEVYQYVFGNMLSKVGIIQVVMM